MADKEGPTTEQLNPKFSLMDYIKQHKWVIIGIVVLIGAAIVGYFFVVKPMMEKDVMPISPPYPMNFPRNGIGIPQRPSLYHEPEPEPEPEQEPEEDENLLDLETIQKNIEEAEGTEGTEGTEGAEDDEISVEDMDAEEEEAETDNEEEEQLTINEPAYSQCNFIYKSKLQKGKQCSNKGIHDSKYGPRCATHRYVA